MMQAFERKGVHKATAGLVLDHRFLHPPHCPYLSHASTCCRGFPFFSERSLCCCVGVPEAPSGERTSQPQETGHPALDTVATQDGALPFGALLSSPGERDVCVG